MDRQTNGGDCITSHANVVSKYAKETERLFIIRTHNNVLIPLS